MAEAKEKQEIMIIGTKETFLIRVLVKKLSESGLSAYFVPADIDAVNGAWERASLLTYYLDNSEHVKPELLVYLKDKLTEDEKQIVLIGEKIDAEDTLKYLDKELVLETFLRPLDTDKYISTVSSHISLMGSIDKKKNILIVDDDPTYIGLIRDWLRGKYKVSMANSGMQAIKWLSMNHADLILLDFEMPVTTGPQVLEMLRSDSDTQNIPVIFLTGKSDKASVMQVVGLKPEGYLLKSIKRDELLKELEKFFASR
ncbi:MAG: response regulator [Lachnospiraceae bacterium]|nr:response regulator [Lachnospiraceae bacterium]